MIDRKIYFDHVRASLFGGGLSQRQVDGQNDILDVWERIPTVRADIIRDLRWLAYMYATTYHETSKEMWPIEEYGKGQGQSYGKKDPETGQTYYGRGYIQLTWRDNYHKSTVELQLKGDDDIEWHAAKALDGVIAARVMFHGMYFGWFRSDSKGPQTLPRYFDADTEDPYGAREIINGDKTKVPDWSGGVSIGNLIRGYYDKFLMALQAATVSDPVPPKPVKEFLVALTSGNDPIVVTVDGVEVYRS